MTERILGIFNKWRYSLAFVAMLVGSAWGATGFSTTTPSKRFGRLERQDSALVRIDSLNKHEVLDSIAVIRADQRSQDVVITGTGLYRCLHSTIVEQQQLRIKKWCDDELGN